MRPNNFGFRSLLAILLFLVLTQSTSRPGDQNKNSDWSSDADLNRRVVESYGRLPLRFEENRGQDSPEVKFSARGPGYALFLTASEMELSLSDARKKQDAQDLEGEPTAIRLKLIDGNPSPQVTGLSELRSKSNFFLGNEPRRWRAGVANYSQVKYEAVYPGVDLVWHGNQSQLEHDFIVKPGADPRRIKFEISGAETLRVDEEGKLVVGAGSSEIHLLKPVAFQETGGGRREIACHFSLIDARKVQFELGEYDARETLVIDPVVLFGQRLGGSSTDRAAKVAVDKDGAAYVVGETLSSNFPSPSTIQSGGGGTDVFVLKLDPTGSQIVYGTYLGGVSTDRGFDIAVDDAGNAYAVGSTTSANFPTTPGAFQTKLKGLNGAFVAKLNASGTALSYSTLISGSYAEEAYGVDVDSTGKAYVVGLTSSVDLPADGWRTSLGGSPIYKSSDGGAGWNAAARGVLGTIVYHLAIDPADSRTLYAGTSGGLFRSKDGGNQWESLKVGFTGEPVYAAAIDPAAPNVIYVCTYNSVYKSVDGGATFTAKNNGLVNLSFSANFSALLIDPKSPATIYLGTASGVYKSVNGAEQWAAVNTGLGSGFSAPRINRLVADPNNPQTIYTGSSLGVFKTVNGGNNWTPVNAGFLGSGTFGPEILALAIDPRTPETLYASFATSTGSIYKTTDGGATWVNSSTGFSIEVFAFTSNVTAYALAVDPANGSIVYAGSYLGGVFKSLDGGRTWAQINQGLTNSYIRAIAVDSRNPSTVYAGVSSGSDGFAAKLNETGGALEYLTYLGGSETDSARSIAVDAAGAAYICGYTESSDFRAGEAASGAAQPGYSFNGDAFVVKLNPAGKAPLYSTFAGGFSTDYAFGIAINEAGNAYITGYTNSSNFPTVNALRDTFNSSTEIFVAKLNAAGSAFEFSTYLGGGRIDVGNDIAVDRAGNAYVTGYTESPDFPVFDAVQKDPAVPFSGASFQDAILMKISASGRSLIYSTFLGGFSSDTGLGVEVDRFGNAYVVGQTSSTTFPAQQPQQQGLGDGFIVKIGVDAELAVTQTVDRNPAMVNGALKFTVTVVNNGPSPANGVTLTDQLPDGVDFVSARPSAGSCAHSNGRIACSLGNLAAKATASVALQLKPTVAGTFKHSVEVAGIEPDTRHANNSSSIEIRISTKPSIYGRVLLAGRPLSGAAVRLSGAKTETQNSNAEGLYQFSELEIGSSYTVTPSLENYSFEPALVNYGALMTDQAADFAATTCAYALETPVGNAPAAGGSVTFNLTATARCPWTTEILAGGEWLKVSGASSGAGSGKVVVTAAALGQGTRTGRLRIAGQDAVVYQGASVCAVPQLRPASYPLGDTTDNNTPKIELGDVNGDRIVDLLALQPAIRLFENRYRALNVLFGNGQAGFTQNSELRLPEDVNSFAAADFDGDGKLDLAVSTRTSVALYRNDGAGNFTAGAPIPIAFNDSFPNVVTLAGDFNRDGKPDVLNYFNDTFRRVLEIRLLLNNGAGGLQPPINLSFQNVKLLGLSDANGDGNLDLIADSGAIAWYPGDGKGGFGAPIGSPVRISPSDSKIGDFNGDDRPDLALLLPESTSSSNQKWSVGIMLGDGAGRFGEAKVADVGELSGPLTIGDFNGDGKTDAVISAQSYQLPNRLVMLAGAGDGRLSPPATVIERLFAGVTLAGDVDHDLRTDLIYFQSELIEVFFNRCGVEQFIAGKVADGAFTAGLSDVTMRLDFSAATARTDSGGNYEFRQVSRSTYRVTPSRDGFEFTPPNRQLTVGNAGQFADFVASRKAAIVNAANFNGPPIAPESIASGFAVRFTVNTAATTTIAPPTSLGGLTGSVTDADGIVRPVRFFYVSPAQINFLIPPGLATGTATFAFSSVTAAARIEPVAPGLFSADSSGKGLASAVVLRVKSDGSQSYEPVFRYDETARQFVAVPIDFGAPGDELYLALFGTGVRLRSSLAATAATIGGLNAEVVYVGAAGELYGMDQINLRLPRALAGRGVSDVVFRADGKSANTVQVSFR